jgi:hypothetical protein
MTALAPAERDRLVKILGLLASDKSGERDAAGLAAMRQLRALGLVWGDVISGAPRPTPVSSNRSWRDVSHACLSKADSLSIWQLGFLTSINAQTSLSPKQAQCLRAIADRVLRGRAA